MEKVIHTPSSAVYFVIIVPNLFTLKRTEGVSEAGSNESEDSSSIDLEAEDQNDNLSDMISANVSGRGTPNISGRLIII